MDFLQTYHGIGLDKLCHHLIHTFTVLQGRTISLNISDGTHLALAFLKSYAEYPINLALGFSMCAISESFYFHMRRLLV